MAGFQKRRKFIVCKNNESNTCRRRIILPPRLITSDVKKRVIHRHRDDGKVFEDVVHIPTPSSPALLPRVRAKTRTTPLHLRKLGDRKSQKRSRRL